MSECRHFYSPDDGRCPVRGCPAWRPREVRRLTAAERGRRAMARRTRRRWTAAYFTPPELLVSTENLNQYSEPSTADVFRYLHQQMVSAMAVPAEMLGGEASNRNAAETAFITLKTSQWGLLQPLRHLDSDPSAE